MEISEEKKMPNAYLVEIHKFLVAKKRRATLGLQGAQTEEERAYFQGMLDEVRHMAAFVSKKYNMDFQDYGEAV